ncbi:MAG: hypothetical protein QXW80_05855 [Candidatus Micrarchaeia archaeon]
MEVHTENKKHTEASIAMEHLSILASSGKGIRKFYGDGAFDQSSMFNKLHLLHVKLVVKIRKNASADMYRKAGRYRRRIVREYKNLGYER